MQIYVNITQTKAGDSRFKSIRKESLWLIEQYEDDIEQIEKVTQKRCEQAQMLFDIVIKDHPAKYNKEHKGYIFTDVFFYRVQERESAYMEQIKAEYA